MDNGEADSNQILGMIAALAFVVVWLAVYAVGCAWRKVRAVLR